MGLTKQTTTRSAGAGGVS